jgi:hypothetical protein
VKGSDAACLAGLHLSTLPPMSLRGGTPSCRPGGGDDCESPSRLQGSDAPEKANSPRSLGALARGMTRTADLTTTKSAGVERATAGADVSDALKSKASGGNSLVSRLSTGLRRLNTPSVDPNAPGVQRVVDFLHPADAPSLPPFRLKEYGIDWYRDNAHLLTNAIRREVMDLYVIVRSMFERKARLQDGDIRSLYIWFETFADFFIFAMTLIERTLIPWVERSRELPEDPYLEGEGGRMKVGKDIVRTVERIVKHKPEFLAMTHVSAFRKLHRVLKTWTLLTLGYIDSLDADSAAIVKAFCAVEECQNMHRWVANRVVESPNKATNLVLLVRFLEDRPRTLNDWKTANLEPLERGALPQYWRSVAKHHFEVVAYFRRSTPSLTVPTKRSGA